MSAVSLPARHADDNVGSYCEGMSANYWVGLRVRWLFTVAALVGCSAESPRESSHERQLAESQSPLTPGGAWEGSNDLTQVVRDVLSSCPGTSSITYAGNGNDAGESSLVLGTQQLVPMTRPLDQSVCGAHPGYELNAIGIKALAIVQSRREAPLTCSPAAAAAGLCCDTNQDGICAEACTPSIVGTEAPARYACKARQNEEQECVGLAFTDHRVPSAAVPVGCGCSFADADADANGIADDCEGASVQAACGGADLFCANEVSSQIPLGSTGYCVKKRSFELRELNGVPGMQPAGLPDIDADGRPEFHLDEWYRLLGVVYGGHDLDGDGLADGTPAACNTDARRTLVEFWANITRKSCQDRRCLKLHHAFRKGDSEEGTELFRRVAGVAAFCNGTDLEDNDPIRRPCKDDEEVCGPDGTLGLVVPVRVPAKGGGLTGGAIYPQATCTTWSTAAAPGLTDANCLLDDADAGADNGRCRVPRSASGFACLQPKGNDLNGNGTSDIVELFASTDFDGRAFNQVLRQNGGTGPCGSAGCVIAQGSFYRIHTTKTPIVAGDADTCRRDEGSTQQIGCLAQADPCSVGYAELEALSVSGATNLKVGNIRPTSDNIRCNEARYEAGACNLPYPLKSDVYINRLGDVSGEEATLLACLQNRSLTDPILTARGFVAFSSTPGDSTASAHQDQTCTTSCAFLPDGSVCDAGSICSAGQCQGGACVPVFTPTCVANPACAGVACGDQTENACDQPDSCDGSGNCLSNLEEPGAACGSAYVDACDHPDSCDGAGTCQQNFEASGTSCLAPDGLCVSGGECDGLGFCSELTEPDLTACDDGDACTGSDSCSGGVCSAQGNGSCSTEEVAVGGSFSCARLSDGGVRCWGAGVLGNGEAVRSAPPVRVDGITTAISIGAGLAHACAVLVDGSVRCWGAGRDGQLGNGNNLASLAPVTVVGLTGPAIQVAAGTSHSCARLADGSVDCWGANNRGQLGNGSTVASNAAVLVGGSLSGATQLSLGAEHSCVRGGDGAVRCWGNGIYGQLGNGSTASRTLPVLALGLSTVSTLAAGQYHTCAALADGSIQCFGSGYGSSPTIIGGATDAALLSAGKGFTCFAKASAPGVQCFGENATGQLGDGNTCTSSVAPVSVLNVGQPVTLLASGVGHSCAFTTSSGLWCWGENAVGQADALASGNESLPAAVSVDPVACSPGLALCGGACADVSDDEGNCGFCGRTCGAGQTCQAGICRCPKSGLPGGACPSDLVQVNDFDASALGLYTDAALRSEFPTIQWQEGLDANQQRVSIVDDANAYSGRSVKVTYPVGAYGGINSGAQWLQILGQSFEELYLSYRVRVDTGFDFRRGAKLPGLCGGACNDGNDTPDGTDGWSARNMWRDAPDGRMTQYLYHPDQADTEGDYLRYNLGLGDRLLVPGQWHLIEHRIKMNAVGQCNGRVQAWFDGQLALDEGGLRFRTTPALAIDRFYFSTFLGGQDASWAPDHSEHAHFDEIVISRQPIFGGAE